ncbi:Solute carrier family 35 member G1 [Halotydeus destructor]|nr:Solute carrier family 35 member G1 [Halotydeus destructor]
MAPSAPARSESRLSSASILDDWLTRGARSIPGFGLILAVISGVSFALSGFAVEMTPNIDPTIMVSYRSAVQLIVYATIALMANMPLLGVFGERKYLFLRSVGGFGSFVLAYYSFAYMTFADSNTICMSAPVYVGPVAWIFLREKCTKAHALLVVVTMAGVVLISRPTFLFADLTDVSFTSDQQVKGVILSLTCAWSITLSVIALRKCPKTPAPVIISWFSFWSIIFGIVLLVILKYGFKMSVGFPVTRDDYIWLNINAVLGVIGQAFFVWALKIEEAGLVTLVRTFDIVVAFILQILFLHQKVVWTSIVGTLVVCSTIGITCLKKMADSRPDKFPLLAKFLGSK